MLLLGAILSTILAIVFLYTTLNLLKKHESLEEYIEQQEKFIQSQELQTSVLLQTLHKLDSKHMFEKDDEVGSLFDIIKDTIEKYAERNAEKEQS
jgi:hypothetical protein